MFVVFLSASLMASAVAFYMSAYTAIYVYCPDNKHTNLVRSKIIIFFSIKLILYLNCFSPALPSSMMYKGAMVLFHTALHDY
jgi:hypothetical protein